MQTREKRALPSTQTALDRWFELLQEEMNQVNKNDPFLTTKSKGPGLVESKPQIFRLGLDRIDRKLPTTKPKHQNTGGNQSLGGPRES